MITQSRLLELLAYEPYDGIFRWKVRTHGKGGVKNIGDIAGCAHSMGYVFIGLDGGRYLAHRLVFLYLYDRWPPHEVDHINRNRADNRLSNLREATRSQNGKNSRLCLSTSNKHGFVGIYKLKTPYPKAKSWVARLNHNGKVMCLGVFHTKEEAAATYEAARIKYHGEFAAV